MVIDSGAVQRSSLIAPFVEELVCHNLRRVTATVCSGSEEEGARLQRSPSCRPSVCRTVGDRVCLREQRYRRRRTRNAVVFESKYFFEENMLCTLPPEVILRVLKYCDLFTLLQFGQTCSECHCAIQGLMRKKECLDVYVEYYLPYTRLMEHQSSQRSTIRAKKLLDFMQNYISKRLLCLSMRKAPVLLSTSDLIKLATQFPSITYLDIGQPNGDWPQFDNKVVYSLAYFKKLKTLKIDGTLSKRVVRRGGGHHDPTIFSIKVLSSLEHFEIECHHDTLTTILKTMAINDTTLPYLKRVKFSVKHTSVSYPDQLIWFLSNHKNLEDVRIHNALFATIPQIEHFYSALCHLPKLKTLVLERCAFCDRIDHNLQRQFYFEMERKQVLTVGGVRNMRFDPDNNH